MIHKDLEVWKLSVDMVIKIYEITENFPETEKFGLTSQMRRSAISVPSIISEGAARASTKEFIRFLQIARGSLCELDTQIEIAERLKYIDLERVLKKELVVISKMLFKLVQQLQLKINQR